jgi:putative sterol carrier protein
LAFGSVTKGFRFLLWLANRDPKARDFMQDWSTGGTRTIQFDLKGEEPFHIQIRNTHATLQQGETAFADVMLRGRSSLFSKILAGEVDPDEAYSRQRYDIMGSIDDAIRFRYMAERIQDSHTFLIGLLRTMLRIFA